MNVTLTDILVGAAIAVLVFIGLVLLAFHYATDVTVDTSPAPTMTTWEVPGGCPRELTTQDGTRWAPPSWGNLGCEASIIWTWK